MASHSLTFCLALSLLAADAAMAADEVSLPRLYVNYSATPPLGDLAKFDTCILDPDARVDLTAIRKPNQTFIAYVSTVEARQGSDLERAASELGVPVIARNDAWGSKVLDVTNAGWEKAVLKTAQSAATKGFDGLFLDTIDSLQLVAKADPTKADAAKAAMVQLVTKLRRQFPGAKLIINRGFDLLPAIHDQIDGVLVESIYQTCDASGRNFKAVSEKDSAWLEQKIRAVKAMGLSVFGIDYVDPTKPDLAAKTMKRLLDLGCVPFITTPAINGTQSSTGREVPRRILVVFGWDPVFADKPGTWPIDTLTAGHFQTFLEWLGYELDYLDVGKRNLPSPLPPEYAGVILDQTLSLRPEQEEQLMDWLAMAKERSVPILLGGGIPFMLDEVNARFGRLFECQGSLKNVSGVKDVTIHQLDATMMNAEVEVKPRSLVFHEVTAPPDAKVFLALKARTTLDEEVHSDPVFLAPWGGMWLEPFIALRATQEHRSFFADPLRFLQRWLRQSESFPVPDATTMNGRRMFYSHIDGDGFSSLSHFPGHPLCAEVMRDEVLKKYAVPVTVSVIEAEMMGWLRSSKPEDAPKLQDIARSLFALPNVQAASHTFSHPFQMDPNDPNPGHYTLTHAPFNDAISYPKIEAEREIKGSIEFINNHLLPANKRVELLLWPGNTRPGTAALRWCRELGVQNMNGGDTIISRVYPGVAGIAPRTCPWDDELQIFASNQNEFMYADGFAGPYYGGFATVVDTFKLTEAPRRMKPVNIYYHFYSATFVSSLRALKQIYDWCAEQPLHPVTAAEFARIVRDARDTSLRRISDSHWQIASKGHLRTLRIDEAMGMPDMTKCQGVLGWKSEQGIRYIHTDGRPVVDLVLASQPPEHLHLVDASAMINFEELTARRVAFTTEGWGSTVSLTMGGFPANASGQLVVRGRTTTVHSDATGSVKLTVPAQCGESITLEVAAYAPGQ